MNNENVKELIKQMRGQAATPELSALLDQFETFIHLAEKKNEQNISEEIEAARNQCFKAIETALSSIGLTPEGMQEHLENPGNFSAEEWQKIQGLKEEYLGTPAPLSNKRIKIRGAKI